MRWTKQLAALAAVLCLHTLAAQQPAPSQLPIVVLDPAHGASDSGAHIGDQLAEKDINLQIANKLRLLLQSRGFDIRMTRNNDPEQPLTNMQRASTANQARATACVVIHSTASGMGIHVYASSLPESSLANQPLDPNSPVHWSKAQLPYVSQSSNLLAQLRDAFTRSHLPVVAGRSWLPPLDNLQCPAVVIEMAPLHDGDNKILPNDADYQQQVAQAIAGTLLVWKNRTVRTGGEQ